MKSELDSTPRGEFEFVRGEFVPKRAVAVLRAMAEGAKCYYFYLEGTYGLWPKDGWETRKWITEPEVTYAIFRHLTSGRLIKKEGEVGQGDLRFAANTRADIYDISEKGAKLVQEDPQAKLDG